jgi:hypothetical protein
MRRALVVFLSSLLLTACGDDGVSPQLAEVERAQSRWTAQGLVHYTVEARILCFCPPAMNQWHELTVASDSIIAIRAVDTTVPEVAMAVWFSSVDEVFRRVRSWPSSMRGNRFEAEFDEATGLPLTVNLITSPQIADGGARYEFRALKPGLFTRASYSR